ncbi:hypothetical protein [Paraburkholderia sp. MM5482-R1]|uniref:hypothetical protein n=1 Tax=unclassified Paraburkholderia TaxID=2615204 RepID=UPI003D22E27A
MGIEIDSGRAAEALFANVHVDVNAIRGSRGDSVATLSRARGYGTVAPTSKVVGAMNVLKEHPLDYMLSTEMDFDVAIGISRERFLKRAA